jgi:small subunit ribosomal protein S16
MRLFIDLTNHRKQAMLTIRLARGGAKKKPYYRMVVTDSRNARDSGAIKEKVGHFNPMAKGDETMIHMDTARIDYWREQGAQTSDKVTQLIKIFLAAQKKGEKAVMRTKTPKVKTPAAVEAKEAAPAAETKAEAKEAAPAAETKAAAKEAAPAAETKAAAKEAAPADKTDAEK